MSSAPVTASTGARSFRRRVARLVLLTACAAPALEACFLDSRDDNSAPLAVDAGRDAAEASAPAAVDAAHDAPAADVAQPLPDAAPDAFEADAAIDARDGAEPDAADASAPFDAADAADALDGADAADTLDAADAFDAFDAADSAVAPPVGCADGTREGFTVLADSPRLAGCSGAWSVPGITGVRSPQCARAAGNDGTNAAGAGCGVADLCATGWHVCTTSADVAARTSHACSGAADDGGAPLFFATGQSGAGVAACGVGSNDVFGCGNAGGPVSANCAPLDRFSGNLCATLGAPWSCGNDSLHEADNVTKSASSGGGVLCCAD